MFAVRQDTKIQHEAVVEQLATGVASMGNDIC